MSQRERLLARPRPSIAYQLLVDPDTVEAARAALAQAQGDARQVALHAKPASAARRRAERVVADAQAAVEACYETIVLRALPTAGELTTETLIAAHPPTAEQMAAAQAAREQAAARGEQPPAWPDWDDDTFRPALLAACGENGMDTNDWSAFLASHVSEGEKRGLWMACLAVNQRERVADPLVLPKGLMAMLSSTLS